MYSIHTDMSRRTGSPRKLAPGRRDNMSPGTDAVPALDARAAGRARSPGVRPALRAADIARLWRMIGSQGVEGGLDRVKLRDAMPSKHPISTASSALFEGGTPLGVLAHDIARAPGRTHSGACDVVRTRLPGTQESRQRASSLDRRGRVDAGRLPRHHVGWQAVDHELVEVVECGQAGGAVAQVDERVAVDVVLDLGVGLGDAAVAEHRGLDRAQRGASALEV